MNAIILSIGDELILGQTVDTNSAWLSTQLAALGIRPIEHVTVDDDLERIIAALRRAASTADVIVATGGLGPTDDDLTRQAVAQCLDSPLVLHEESLRHIQDFFDRLGREMVPRNRVQALLPQAASVIPNPIGTAPGFTAALGGARAFFFPGVPVELRRMFPQVAREYLSPISAAAPRQVVVSRAFHTFGAGESNIAEMLGDMMTRGRNPLVNTTVAHAIVSLRVNAAAPDPEAALRLIEPVEQQLRARLGNLIFGVDDETLPAVVGQLLRQHQAALVTAESCTGGLLAQDITEIPGASDYFRCGWVVYSNEAKAGALHVDPAIIGHFGAVSEPVALQLAHNARMISAVDYALAITGIAGPTGETPDKPVGLVYIALADAANTVVTCHHFHGDRAMVRRRAVNTALDRLRLKLL